MMLALPVLPRIIFSFIPFFSSFFTPWFFSTTLISLFLAYMYNPYPYLLKVQSRLAEKNFLKFCTQFSSIPYPQIRVINLRSIFSPSFCHLTSFCKVVIINVNTFFLYTRLK
uniref:Uncharacterized protein n=1 Tax=Cacopsylla melanoneura TaxID=428564 RepID=A0A8D8XF77_9HEMI